MAEKSQSCSCSLIVLELASSAEYSSSGTDSQLRESALSGRWLPSSLPCLHLPNTPIMQREQSSEVVTLYQQLPPFSYASGLTATEAEILGVMTTESAVDLQPFSASFTLRPPHAPYEACSGLDGTLGACADSADPMLLHEGLHAFHDTPPINFLNGVNDIPDTTLGLRCEATYHFPNDILTAGNGIESVLIPQPNINYSMFLNGSTPGEATWLSPRLYAQVVELTSQCKLRQLHFIENPYSSSRK